MKVAIVHDWLTGMRGGERVLEVLCDLYPDATLYTLLHNPRRISDKINRMRIRTSFIQHLPFARGCYRSYLPLFPLAVEQFDLSGYELVLSSSHCCAKGVITRPSTCHISYCYTPVRYAWDFYHDYFGAGRLNSVSRMVIAPLIGRFRQWDAATASRVDYFVAASENVARRIRKYYRREAAVIHPPVDTGFFTPDAAGQAEFCLLVSAFVPYKRVDLAIEAFNRLALPLVVVGTGPEGKRLRKLAKGNVRFEGEVDDSKLRELYRRSRALVFPGEEDFGLVPLEAQAVGKPVIAFGRGGLLETVIEGTTGTFFSVQSAEALCEAVTRFEKMRFDPARIREHALEFGRERFSKNLADFIEKKLASYREHGPVATV